MKAKFIAAGIIIGVSVGLISSMLVFGGSSYCERVEKNIKSKGKINGTTACYPPGVIEVNLSEKVRNNSDLKCVCRNVYNGKARIFPISVSD